MFCRRSKSEATYWKCADLEPYTFTTQQVNMLVFGNVCSPSQFGSWRTDNRRRKESLKTFWHPKWAEVAIGYQVAMPKWPMSTLVRPKSWKADLFQPNIAACNGCSAFLVQSWPPNIRIPKNVAPFAADHIFQPTSSVGSGGVGSQLLVATHWAPWLQKNIGDSQCEKFISIHTIKKKHDIHDIQL